MVGTLTNQIPASSARKAHKARRWWGKYQDFMLMRLFNSIDLIGCGGDINQSDSCKQCAYGA